jgi:uncharacterized protein YndB with AHSA1/START domain
MTLYVILGAVVAVPAVVFGIGKALPVAHVARGRMCLHTPIGEVWRVLADFASYASWRRGVATTVRVDGAGAERWKEVSAKGESMTFETVEQVPERKLVRRIADEKLPFGGQWVFELEPAGASETIVTVTEQGEVYNPIFRFVSRFIMGHHATLKGFLADLGKKFGQNEEVETS